ncbi:MAG: ABC transporter ATP-binding protein/permease [Acidobacteria bacterium]|nr:ABC transporter ATP-binding protein/permease [Acidobacteriota bacterium]MBU4307247.1 ABC transporter ATP-binding protein/permease [Acidobacteriota bacterium]MBU4405039.1 ABC transporter ATP-binding protein/permease [Acidobacteriota bacterium]MCG2811483.1 ABC transporter ATP-binding protein/permease [Candidatus Aminicenantes bacterium]
MKSWFAYLKGALSRRLPDDKLAAGPKKDRLRSNLRNLLPFVKRHWRKGALGALLILLTSLLAFPGPLITRFLIDKVILGKQLSLLLGVILLLAGIKVAGVLISIFQQYFFTRFEQEVLLEIQQTLFDRTLRLPKSFFDTKETGYLMSRLLGDVNGLRWFFSSTMVYIFSSVLRFAGGTVFLIYLNWRLALAVLVVLPLMFLSVRFFGRKLRVLSHHGMERHAEVYQSVQESLAQTSLIKAFATEKRTLNTLMGKLRASLQVGMEQNTLGSVANLAIGAAPDLAHLIVLAGGAFLIIRGEWSVGSLLAFQSYVGFVYGPAQFLATANFQWQSAVASLERVSALFDLVPEEQAGVGLKTKRLRGEVEFQQVSFSYNGIDTVLQDISFMVSAGEHMAVVGPSGVGKTTLVSLLLQFYRPQKGQILIDGRPAKEYELNSLRRRIGYVPQSPTLLSGTIEENLRYGDPEASEVQIEKAARAAGIHEYITSLPMGYKALVGECGVNFSEGQKQRLAIARALVKDPDILILDEPTSALDSQTEASIFASLPELVCGKTLFIIAHRLSTIRQSDRILCFNDKGLVGAGSHEELQEKCDYYQSLLRSQNVQS